MHFANSTKLHPTETATRYSGEIRPGWDVLGNANGGYTMAMFGRAALMATERREVISVSAHFLSPGLAGPIQVDVETIKACLLYTSDAADE